MSAGDAGEQLRWQQTLAALIARAPGWLRDLASDQLHIAGFTNVQLDHPVLDLRTVEDDDRAQRALTLFLAAALLRGAGVARVHAGRGAQAAALARLARKRFRPALERIDDENVSLLRYFDAYLKPAPAIGDAGGRRIAELVRTALADDAKGA